MRVCPRLAGSVKKMSQSVVPFLVRPADAAEVVEARARSQHALYTQGRATPPQAMISPDHFERTTMTDCEWWSNDRLDVHAWGAP